MVPDVFGGQWRISIPPVTERGTAAAYDWQKRHALETLVFNAFDHTGAREDAIAGPLLELYGEVTGSRIGDRLRNPRRPSDDRSRILVGFDNEIRRTLTQALRTDFLRIEEAPRTPWPLVEEPEKPVSQPPPLSGRDIAHWLELRVVTTKGKDAGGIGCRVALPDRTIKMGVTGADGIVRFDGVDKAGKATVVLPDIVPFSPDEARQPPVNKGALRVTQDGVTAPVDARTLLEIPPQVYRARLVGMFFDTSKSFLLPGGALQGIRRLTTYLAAHASAELLIVGHTDRAGSDAYNLVLSVERAKATEAFLKDDVDAWVEWFDPAKPAAKRWGVLEVQRMLSTLPEGEDAKFYAVSPPTGRKDASTSAAVKAFQAWSNQTKGTSLPIDGASGRATCTEIVRAYMAFEGTSIPGATVTKTHGCGEFHPQNPTPDGVADPENRRVEIFVFTDGIDPQPVACRSPGCSQYKQWMDKLVESVDFNTEDLPATPLVVGRLPTLFSLGKSFPKPSALPMLREVVKRMTADPHIHAVVMGHTDAIGDDGDAAKEATISKARADAIASLLTGKRDPFEKKFSAKQSAGDPDAAWGWEEVQWMLSAVQADGAPCYVGAVDGHRGDSVLDAIEAFQVASGLKINRHVDKATLKTLVDAYFTLVTDAKTEVHADRIVAVGGGSWHPPRSFGDTSAALEGDEYADSHFLAFRRVDVFLSRVLLVPPTDTCSPSRHEKCTAYEQWCKDSKEVLPDDGLHEFAIRIGDSLTGPVEGCSVSLTKSTDDAGRPLERQRRRGRGGRGLRLHGRDRDGPLPARERLLFRVIQRRRLQPKRRLRSRPGRGRRPPDSHRGDACRDQASGRRDRRAGDDGHFHRRDRRFRRQPRLTHAHPSHCDHAERVQPEWGHGADPQGRVQLRQRRRRDGRLPGAPRGLRPCALRCHGAGQGRGPRPLHEGRPEGPGEYRRRPRSGKPRPWRRHGRAREG